MDVAVPKLLKCYASSCNCTKRGSHHGFQGKTAQFLLQFEKKQRNVWKIHNILENDKIVNFAPLLKAKSK